ncbi:MAG: TonB-dependent receptor [Pseudomonadota bacterium]
MNNYKSRRNLKRPAVQALMVAIPALGYGTFGAAAAAQEDEDPSARRLTPVTVTATKRETSLEDTAVTVSVVQGDDIVDRGVVEVTELFTVVPGVTFNQSPGDLPAISVRGIGTLSGNQTFEQSVGLFLDGVYKPRARQYRDALFDVERVEAIKGAQGVLFGKNTSVGAISVVTRKPGDVLAGEATASYETEFESGSVGLTGDIPLSDSFAVRLGGQYLQSGGYVENTVANRDEPETDRWTIRGTGVYDADGPWTITLMGQLSDQETTGTPFQFLEVFPDVPGAPPLRTIFGIADPVDFQNSPAPFITYPDGSTLPGPGDSQESADAVLTVEYDLGDLGVLTSVSAYSEFDYENFFDVLGTAAAPFAPGGTQVFTEEFSQFTQEFRHTYSGDRLRLTSGIFLQSQDLVFENSTATLNIVVPAGPLAGGNITGRSSAQLDQDLTAGSIFSQASFDFTDRFTVDFGLRLSTEEREALFTNRVIDLFGLPPATPPNFGAPGTTITPFVSPPVDLPGDIEETTLDGGLTLSYDLTEDWLLFGSLSQGTKSGAFNNAGPIPAPFEVDEEVAQTAEVGLKGSYDGGAGYLSASAFIMDIQDFQDSVFEPNAGAAGTGAFVTTSLDAETRGVEVETRYQATPDLVLGATLAYLDTENKDAGGDLSRAPEFTSSWSVDYERPVTTDFALQAGGLLATNSGFLHRQTPQGALPLPVNAPIDTGGAFQLLDLYLGMRHETSGIQLRAEVKNVTDESYVTFAFPQPVLQTGLNGALNRPRTFTLSLRVPFGGE